MIFLACMVTLVAVMLAMAIGVVLGKPPLKARCNPFGECCQGSDSCGNSGVCTTSSNPGAKP